MRHWYNEPCGAPGRIAPCEPNEIRRVVSDTTATIPIRRQKPRLGAAPPIVEHDRGSTGEVPVHIRITCIQSGHSWLVVQMQITG